MSSRKWSLDYYATVHWTWAILHSPEMSPDICFFGSLEGISSTGNQSKLLDATVDYGDKLTIIQNNNQNYPSNWVRYFKNPTPEMQSFTVFTQSAGFRVATVFQWFQAPKKRSNGLWFWSLSRHLRNLNPVGSAAAGPPRCLGINRCEFYWVASSTLHGFDRNSMNKWTFSEVTQSLFHIASSSEFPSTKLTLVVSFRCKLSRFFAVTSLGSEFRYGDQISLCSVVYQIMLVHPSEWRFSSTLTWVENVVQYRILQSYYGCFIKDGYCNETSQIGFISETTTYHHLLAATREL